MPDFSNALQGYLAGMQANSRLQTPVQAFLQQLRESQQMQLQREQNQGMLAFRQGMLGNAEDRNAIAAQHWQDMAEATKGKLDLSTQRFQAWQGIQNRLADIKELSAKAAAGSATARAQLAAAMADYVKTKNDVLDKFGDAEMKSVIDRNEAMAGLTGAKTGQVGEPGYSDVLNAFKAKQKAYDSLLPSQQKITPKPTMQDAYQDLIKAKPSPATTPGGQASLVPDAGALPPLPDSVIPQDTNPLLALLKAPTPPSKLINTLKRPVAPSQGPAPVPAPTAQPTPVPPPEINYPSSPEPMPSGPVIPVGDIGDTFGQQASADPLHGMYSQREPGVYQMNGKQYLVDGSGMIQALPA